MSSNQFTRTSYITVEPLLWDTSFQGTPLFRVHLYPRDTSIPGTTLFKGHLYSGDISIQGTPPFRGHKIWSQKSAHIIFESITSIEGTPLLRGNGHFLWVPKPGCIKLPLNFPLNFSHSLYMGRHLITGNPESKFHWPWSCNPVAGIRNPLGA